MMESSCTRGVANLKLGFHNLHMTVELISPRLAATLILLRSVAEEPLQTLMVVRHGGMAFASGALVFPGGSVDRGDRVLAEQIAEGGAVPFSVDEIALRIAAIRETFEESGILLANDRDTRAPVANALAESLVERCRRPVEEGRADFAEMMRQENLVPAIDRLVPFARWITPPIRPKRFDTHFFIAEAPAGQVLAHDGEEAVEAVWIAPKTAIDETESGRFKLVFATRMNLLRLGNASSPLDAIASARNTPVVTVVPEFIDTADGKAIRIPAEAGYGGDLFPVIDPPAM